MPTPGPDHGAAVIRETHARLVVGKHGNVAMSVAADVVCLLDVDQVIADRYSHPETSLGFNAAARCWAAFEALRAELGYADYLGALQSYRADIERSGGDVGALLLMSSFLIDYPFADLLYPQALDVIGHLRSFGPTVILSDGEVVFQPLKVQRSGLWDAVAGQVLIYVHKEQTLDEIQRRYPARHYLMLEDKLRLLARQAARNPDRFHPGHAVAQDVQGQGAHDVCLKSSAVSTMRCASASRRRRCASPWKLSA